MTPAARRYTKLCHLRRRYDAAGRSRKSRAAIHAAMCKLVLTQLRAEIKQDRRQ